MTPIFCPAIQSVQRVFSTHTGFSNLLLPPPHDACDRSRHHYPFSQILFVRPNGNPGVLPKSPVTGREIYGYCCRMTGVSNSSLDLISNFRKSLLLDCRQVQKRHFRKAGILPAVLLVCELCMPGSSAATNTSPPLTPHMKQSLKGLPPISYMLLATKRSGAGQAAPIPSSRATFSLGPTAHGSLHRCGNL